MAFERGNDNCSFLCRSAPGELQHFTSKLGVTVAWRRALKRLLQKKNNSADISFFLFFSPSLLIFFTKEHAFYFHFFGIQLLSLLSQSHNLVWDCAATVEMSYMNKSLLISKHHRVWLWAYKLLYQKRNSEKYWLTLCIPNFHWDLKVL